MPGFIRDELACETSFGIRESDLRTRNTGSVRIEHGTTQTSVHSFAALWPEGHRREHNERQQYGQNLSAHEIPSFEVILLARLKHDWEDYMRGLEGSQQIRRHASRRRHARILTVFVSIIC